MNEIVVQSPTRIDLAGGTLDCWPLYLFAGDCFTINLSIDILTTARLTPQAGESIQLIITDLKYQKEFKKLSDVFASNDEELTLIKEHLRFWQPKEGFSLTTQSQSPVGGGLGGSSSLSVSLLKAFGQWLGRKWELNELVNVAHNIEARVLKTPTGTQDYVPAASPGLNAISYNCEGFQVHSMDFPVEYFSERLLLVYTGRPHHSGLNNWEVIQSAVNQDQKVLGLLKELASVANELKVICAAKEWEALPRIFNDELRIRKGLSAGFTSPEIDRLEQMAKQHGALATKICGAGGGGCVFLWCDPQKKADLKNKCSEEGFQVLNAKPVSAHGH